VLRVLFLNDTSRNGGPGRTLFTILKHTDPSRIERHVVLPREGLVAGLLRDGDVTESLTFEPGILENPFEPWSRPLERTDFEAPLALQGLRAMGNGARALMGIAKLRALIEEKRIDVIFCNGTSAGFLGAFLGKITRTKVLWHVFYSSVADVLKPLHRALAASSAVSAIACVSECTRTQFAHCADKASILHDSIDTEAYSLSQVEQSEDLRAVLKLPKNAVLFGSQGRIVPKKGYLELVEAMGSLLASLPEKERKRMHLVVVGDTPEDTKVNHLEECKARAHALAIDSHVHFLGFRPDVKPLLAAFDVVVVPSVYEDPLPRAVMEAMAMEKPVVAFAVGGIPEMVVHEQTGLLISKTEDLAGPMRRYAGDAKLRKAHGKAGRARITAEFDARMHGKKIEEALIAAWKTT
jgi:glycosyltransferase involved in cell wall biosynthesis